jgi:hypothetical protein
LNTSLSPSPTRVNPDRVPGSVVEDRVPGFVKALHLGIPSAANQPLGCLS